MKESKTVTYTQKTHPKIVPGGLALLKGYKTYSKAHTLLLKAARSVDYQQELQFVLSFYGSDFDFLQLSTQLEMFSLSFKTAKEVTLSDVFAFFRDSTPAQADLLCQVSKLLVLLLVMPATNAQSERSFSAVRRVKTYLRLTTTQQRLNNLMVLHVHKSCTDALDLFAVANEFIDGSDHRKFFFWSQFKKLIMKNNFTY